MNMDEKILETLSQLVEGQKKLEAGQQETNKKLDRLESKADSIDERLAKVEDEIGKLIAGQSTIKQQMVEIAEDILSVQNVSNKNKLAIIKMRSQV